MAKVKQIQKIVNLMPHVIKFKNVTIMNEKTHLRVEGVTLIKGEWPLWIPLYKLTPGSAFNFIPPRIEWIIYLVSKTCCQYATNRDDFYCVFHDMNKKSAKEDDKHSRIPSADGIQQNPFYKKPPKQRDENDRNDKVIKGISKHQRTSDEIRVISKSRNALSARQLWLKNKKICWVDSVSMVTIYNRIKNWREEDAIINTPKKGKRTSSGS